MSLLIQLRDAGLIYLFWILIHWVCSHLYADYCAGNTISKVLLSPFVVPTPYCGALRWVVSKGAEVITLMWILLGKWILELMLGFNLIPTSIKKIKK
jgi:hypothetical protein